LLQQHKNCVLELQKLKAMIEDLHRYLGRTMLRHIIVDLHRYWVRII
jgi:hypothetical protein